MKKIMKQSKLIYVGIVSMILILGLVTIVAANNFSFLELIAKYAGEKYADKLPIPLIDDIEENNEFGVIATSTTGWSAQPNIALDSSYQGEQARFDMGERTKDGIAFGYEIVDFASVTTTLVAIENNAGKEIYIDRKKSYIKITGQPTTTINFFSGTSTNQYINPYLTSYYGGYSSIVEDLRIATNTPTSTVLTFSDYNAFNNSLSEFDLNNIAEGQGAVRVEQKDWVTLFATTTEDFRHSVTGTDNLFDGTLYLFYFTVD